MTTPSPKTLPDLLPCPFCGGAPNFVKHSAGVRGTMGFDSWDAVACKACGGTVGACDRRFRDRDDAAKAWNTRPSQPLVEVQEPSMSMFASVADFEAEKLARRFHEAYERLAPSFGYETRPETREFDPSSRNGRLMIAVCREVGIGASSPSGSGEEPIRVEFDDNIMIEWSAPIPDGVYRLTPSVTGGVGAAPHKLNPTKIEPGSATYFTLMGAEFGYNFLGGDEYRSMQAYSKKLWDAARASVMPELNEFPVDWSKVSAPHPSQSFHPSVVKWHSLSNRCYACNGPCVLRMPAINALAAHGIGPKGAQVEESR